MRRSMIPALVILLSLMAVLGQEATAKPDEQSKKDTEKAASGPLQFQEVVQVEGATKDQLYSAALVWFGEAFRSAKDVLQTQDRESGTIIGKPLFSYEPIVFVAKTGIQGVVRYSISIEVKDGRYRYTIGDFVHEGNKLNRFGAFSFGLLTTDEKCPYKISGPTASGREETWTDLKKKATGEAERLTKSMREKLSTAAAKKEAW